MVVVWGSYGWNCCWRRALLDDDDEAEIDDEDGEGAGLLCDGAGALGTLKDMTDRTSCFQLLCWFLVCRRMKVLVVG